MEIHARTGGNNLGVALLGTVGGPSKNTLPKTDDDLGSLNSKRGTQICLLRILSGWDLDFSYFDSYFVMT